MAGPADPSVALPQAGERESGGMGAQMRWREAHDPIQARPEGMTPIDRRVCGRCIGGKATDGWRCPRRRKECR